jgi:hypothetical protein
MNTIGRFLKYMAFEFFYILRPLIRLALKGASFACILVGVIMFLLNLLERNDLGLLFILLVPVGLIFSVCALRYDAFLFWLSPDDMKFYLAQ